MIPRLKLEQSVLGRLPSGLAQRARSVAEKHEMALVRPRQVSVGELDREQADALAHLLQRAVTAVSLMTFLASSSTWSGSAADVDAITVMAAQLFTDDARMQPETPITTVLAAGAAILAAASETSSSGPPDWTTPVTDEGRWWSELEREYRELPEPANVVLAGACTALYELVPPQTRRDIALGYESGQVELAIGAAGGCSLPAGTVAVSLPRAIRDVLSCTNV